jgi:hypothetical protein
VVAVDMMATFLVVRSSVSTYSKCDKPTVSESSLRCAINVGRQQRLGLCKTYSKIFIFAVPPEALSPTDTIRLM